MMIEAKHDGSRNPKGTPAMRQHCYCEWNDKGDVLTLCAAHQAFEAKRCTGFMRDLGGLRAALTEIGKGEGAFSRDQLTFATNTIESMKQIALDALTK